MLDWDDLRVFLAAARSSSFSGAGLRVGMDATTIARRVQRLESTVGATLFVRSPQGLQLTSAGARVLEASLQAETAVEGAEAVNPGVGGPFGSVRLSTSEGLGTQILAPALPDLTRSRPGLIVELVASPGFLSPSTREADIAVTLSPPESARLTVERLTDYHLGLYASEAYLQENGAPENRDQLANHRLVGYIDDLLYSPELRYLSEVKPGLHAGIVSSSIRAQLEIIQAGGGVGVLPAFMASGATRLRPVLVDDVRLTRTFWVAVHNDLKSTQRIKAVERWLAEVVAANRTRFLPTEG